VPIELSDEDAQKMAELSDALEDQDDVSEVYTNAHSLFFLILL